MEFNAGKVGKSGNRFKPYDKPKPQVRLRMDRKTKKEWLFREIYVIRYFWRSTVTTLSSSCDGSLIPGKGKVCGSAA